MPALPYPPPVDRLLTLGDPRGPLPEPGPPPTEAEFQAMLEQFAAEPLPKKHEPHPLQSPDWPDYRAYGLGPEHIPDLIRLAGDEALVAEVAADDTDNPVVYAPVHAWRALGQLRAEDAIKPLIDLFEPYDDWDWYTEDVPEVFGLIGPAAIAPLAAFLANPLRGAMQRTTAGRALGMIGRMHPESRAAVITAITDVIEESLTSDEDADDLAIINGFLISDLLDLEAVETLPLLARVFAADLVDLSIVGDLEEVEIAFGVREERETPTPDTGWLSEMRMPSGSPDLPPFTPLPPTGGGSKSNPAKSEKRKRKIAQQSRRTNRKRKK